MKWLDVHLHKVPKVIAACCTLHNICEIHGDEFDQHWLELEGQQLQQPYNPDAVDHAAGNGMRGLFVDNVSTHHL